MDKTFYWDIGMVDNKRIDTSIQLELQEKLQFLFNSFSLQNEHKNCYSGLIFQQGKRTILQINVSAKDLPNLLQAKPATANNPDSGKDRPEIKGHAEEIKQYIMERSQNGQPWVLGTFTANVAPERITVFELGLGMCIVSIPDNVKLDLTDGQHRRQAIYQIIKENKVNLIKNERFAITLILEDNFYQCQSDFRDLAKAKPVEKSLILSFGDSLGRVGITKILIEKVAMFRGKTDKIHKAPSKKDKLIYTTNYIARAVSCAFTDNAEAELENVDIHQASEALSQCLNRFFSQCSDTQYFVEKRIEQLTLEEVNQFRKDCLLGVSVGLEVLGRLLYCTYDVRNNSFNPQKVSRLAQIDWSRKNSLWHNNIVRVNSKLKQPTLTISWGASAVADAVKMVKVELGWM